MAANACVRNRVLITLRRLGNEARGAVMLEFAFVVIPLIGLMMASLYTSLVFFSSQALETTVQSSARRMITGAAQQAGGGLGTTQAAYKTQVCAALPGYMKCSRLFVDVQRATTLGSLNMAAPVVTIDADGNVTNAGNYAVIAKNEYGLVRLAYVWQVGTGPNGLDLSNTTGGNRILVATSVFQAEPFGS